MPFGEAVATCLRKYADGTGRARRSEYWWFVLFGALVGFAAGLVDGVLGTSAVGLLATLALLVPSVAVGARRLHDTGRSGWWLLVALVPLVGFVVLLVFFASEGQRGENRYGPDPKGILWA